MRRPLLEEYRKRYIIFLDMALNIKNEETECLARELARQTGESITEAIRVALEDRLQRVKKRRAAKGLKEDVRDILARVDALPTVDTRSEDEILGYGQHGVADGN
jgi:antitoxin VapB